jgi:pimeloyl-ACP methyl ester carboxylesterase
VAGPEPTPADPAPAGTAVLVHGLGGSHVNWARLGPLRSRAGWTVWAPDLAGFGLTGLNGRSAAVDDQLDLLAGFIATVADPPVRLVGNSMGGLLALSLAAQRPELVASLVLVAPALPPVGSPDRQVFRRFALGAAPGVAEWWFRHVARHRTPAAQTAEVLHLCVADTSVLDTGLLQAHTAMAAHRRLLGTVERAVPTATRSLLLRLGPGRASVWATVDAVTAPALVVGGEQDRLVTPATLDRLAARRSDWGRVRLDRMGHVPMLEAPEPLAELVAAVPVDRPPWPEGEVVRAAAG